MEEIMQLNAFFLVQITLAYAIVHVVLVSDRQFDFQVIKISLLCPFTKVLFVIIKRHGRGIF